MDDPSAPADDDSAPADDAGMQGTDAAIDALLDAYTLKDERRTGWQLRGVRDPESVAAHSWGVAYLVLALGDRFCDDLPSVDRDRALRLAVVHDVAEATTGDIPTRADPTAETPDAADKTAAERDAMHELAGPLPDHVCDAWETYERRASPEAVLVKECDLLDVCLQALVYERADRYDPAAGDPAAFSEYDDLDEFFVTTKPRLQTPTGRALFDRIQTRYRVARDES